MYVGFGFYQSNAFYSNDWCQELKTWPIHSGVKVYKISHQDSVRIYTGPTYLTATGPTQLRHLHLTTAYLLLARILLPKW